MVKVLLLLLCQFDPVFNEDIVKPKPIPKTEVPVSIEFLAQAPLGGDDKLHIIAYSGTNCRWCKQSHDLVGEGDNRMSIDWTEDTLPDTVKNKLRRGYQFPVYVCEQVDGTLMYPTDWKIYSRDELHSMFSATKPLKLKSYAATGAGGTIHGREKIEQLFNLIEQYIGEDVKMTIIWDRTGAQTFPFKAGTDWSPFAVLGRNGNFDFKATGSKNPMLAQISSGYTFLDGNDDIQLTPKIIIKGIGSKKFNATESNGQITKLDPITIITIIYYAYCAYQMLNPKMDLQLPGSVDLDLIYKNRQLDMNFNKSPVVHVSAWFEFYLAVKHASLTTQKAHIDFTGSRFIKSREMIIVD